MSGVKIEESKIKKSRGWKYKELKFIISRAGICEEKVNYIKKIEQISFL